MPDTGKARFSDAAPFWRSLRIHRSVPISCQVVLISCPNNVIVDREIDVAAMVGNQIKEYFRGQSVVAVANDPNEHVRQSLVQQLAMLGIACAEIPDTPQFIQYLEEAPADKIILGYTKLEMVCARSRRHRFSCSRALARPQVSEKLRSRHVILSTNYRPVFRQRDTNDSQTCHASAPRELSVCGIRAACILAHILLFFYTGRGLFFFFDGIVSCRWKSHRSSRSLG